MRLFDLVENENTRVVVIYPGRFHPFHIGHGKVFKYLKQKFKGAQIFIASSGKTDAHKSPFSFDEKKRMMMLAGVDPNSIVQAKIPYVASEITDRYDPDNTVVVYAVSEKDMAEDPRFDFPTSGPKMKKNGEPAHIQMWRGIDGAKPLRQHSYITTVPTFTFKIRGEAVNSATQIRNMISNADDTELNQILQDLYGRSDIPENVIEIFKRKLGSSSISENWEEEDLYSILLEAELQHQMITEDKSDLESFDVKTARALNNLKVKYPGADNLLGALVADVEDSQTVSKQNDIQHSIDIAAIENNVDNNIAKLEKQINSLTQELKNLKTSRK